MREIRATVVDSGTLNRKKCGSFNGYHKHGVKLHFVNMYNTSVITGLHGNLISMTPAPQDIFQVMSESEALILKKHLIKIRFDNKMENTSGKVFLLTINIYINSNYATLLGSNNHNPGGKVPVGRKGWPSRNKNKQQLNNY